MFDALHPQPVIESFPLQIQSAASWGTKLFVGTTDGALLVYEVEDEPSFTITLVEVAKTFSKRPIDGLAVLPRSKSLAVLSDSSVVVCDYASLSVTSPLPKTRGCTVLQAKRPPMDSSLAGPTDMLAAVVRKSVLIFAVSQYEVVQLKEIKLSTVPSSLCWAGENDLLAPAGPCLLHVDLRDDSFTGILPLKDLSAHDGGSSLIPARLTSPYILTETADGSNFYLTVHTTVFVFQDYYLAGLIGGRVEVRSVKSGQVIQAFRLADSLSLFSAQLIFAWGPKNVWRLLPLDFEDQASSVESRIDELVSQNRFDDALRFIGELEFPSEADKTSNTTKVRALQAQYMFLEQGKFDEALTILEHLNASPLDVLDLFPSLVDPDAVDSGFARSRPALVALAGYLARERARLAKYRASLLAESDHAGSRAQSSPLASGTSQPLPALLSSNTSVDGDAEDEPSLLEDAYRLSELVDTSLLKTYLALNSPLLGSLVRVENFCDLQTTEMLLIKAEKIDALVDFYFARRMHDKALQHLLALSQDSSQLQRIVAYLRRLKYAESSALIFEYAKHVFASDLALGLTIFTESEDHTDGEQRRQIYEFLRASAPSLVVAYLEHVIFELRDTSRLLHNALAYAYLYEAESADGMAERTAFLITTEMLTPWAPGLLQARAVLYGRLKRHKDALTIYMTKLRDVELANRYCNDNYDPSDPLSRDVFTLLFEQLVDCKGRTHEQNMLFLKLNAEKLNAAKVLRLLETSVPLALVEDFLSKSQDALTELKNQSMIRSAILRAERLQERLVVHKSKRVLVTEENMCRVCLKRISTSIFAHFDDESMAHAYCLRRPQ
ncbi:Vacuolar morphogenesis protein 6 [Polyrhizophydium stewartii]|uniref:Vacuolar morphogenesis protein 6 n=1 Tax=Polyrhizophydium stewartii TaxID=2732419 RepID=A0ABR4NAR6_9FUNG